MTGPNNIKHPAPESGATVEPTDDLRQAVSKALFAAHSGGAYGQADAAIAAYRRHFDGAAADWIAGRDAAADEIDCGCDHRRAAVAGTKSSRYGVCQQGECLARLAAEIRALAPPEDKS